MTKPTYTEAAQFYYGNIVNDGFKSVVQVLDNKGLNALDLVAILTQRPDLYGVEYEDDKEETEISVGPSYHQDLDPEPPSAA